MYYNLIIMINLIKNRLHLQIPTKILAYSMYRFLSPLNNNLIYLKIVIKTNLIKPTKIKCQNSSNTDKNTSLYVYRPNLDHLD